MGGFATRLAIWVRMACALAVLAVGLAHKPPVAEAHGLSPAELSRYVLPDGTLASLCLPSEDGKAKQTHHEMGKGCEACRLGASVLLPAPADTTGRPMGRTLARLLPPRIEAFYRQLFPPNASPRGPPAGLTA